MNVRRVRWRSPLGPYISPYQNRFAAVRWFAYARFATALKYVDIGHAARVLDFGCWDGHFLPTLADCFPEVWAVDDDSGSVIDEIPGCWTTLQLAAQLCKFEGVPNRFTFVKATGMALPFSSGSFDIVFALDTLAHVPHSEKLQVIKELRRITNANGRLVVSLPIEFGFSSQLRNLARRLSRKHPCDYDYDFRPDLKILCANFTVAAVQYWPSTFFRTSVFVDCRC